MRKLLALGVAIALVLAACGGDDDDSSSSEAPVSLSGKVTNEGTETVSGSEAEVELEADDNYFKPTFIEAEPGAKLTLTIKNEGSATHTFTADDANIDQEIAPDDEVKVEVTVPDSGQLDFHCRFHVGSGMQGSIVAKS